MRTWVHPQLLPLRNLPFPPPQKRPAAQPSTARPQSRKSPKILQILLQTMPFPPPQKRPAAQPSTARPQSRKSPKILQILLQTIRPFPRRQKDPPPNHQPFACNPENPPKSCKSCFRQSALSPTAKRIRRPDINRMPAIPKIPQNPANPASDNSGMHPYSLPSLTPCLLYETLNVWKSFTPNSSTSSSKGCVTSRPKPRS